MVPIFGCRKRQRQALYADPIDLPSNNEDDNILMNSLQTQQTPVNRYITQNNFHQTNAVSKNQHFNNDVVERDVSTDRRSGNVPNRNPTHSSRPRLMPTDDYQTRNSSMSSKKPQVQQKLPLLPRPSPVHQRANFRDHVGVQTPRHNTPHSDPRASLVVTPQSHPRQEIITSDSSSKKFELKKRTTSSTRMISCAVEDLEGWAFYADRVPMMFEFYGTLDSTIAYGRPGPEKVFTLRDSSGSVRCKFWEMDRKLPRLSRGSVVRCIGRWNSDHIHCVVLRCIRPGEMKLHDVMKAKCQRLLQSNLLFSREC